MLIDPHPAGFPSGSPPAPADRPTEPRSEDRAALASAFGLTGTKALPRRHVGEVAALDAYAAQLEADLAHEPTAADRAWIDNARRCRMMILYACRNILDRGVSGAGGEPRSWTRELRAWMRAESEALSRLELKRTRPGDRTLEDLFNSVPACASIGATVEPETARPGDHGPVADVSDHRPERGEQ